MKRSGKHRLSPISVSGWGGLKQTQRAQILKKKSGFSSEIENFKRATHQTPIFVGILKVKTENVKRDCQFEVFKRSSEIVFLPRFRPSGIGLGFPRPQTRARIPISCKRGFQGPKMPISLRPHTGQTRELKRVKTAHTPLIRRESSGGMEWLGVWNCNFSGSEFSSFGA